jgi:hypothetical protein
MARLRDVSDSRVTTDAETDAIRTWLAPSGGELPARAAHVAPGRIAREVLTDNADLFKWSPDLPDLRDGAVISNDGGHIVRLSQEFKHVPVDASEVIVTISADGRVNSISNDYHYRIPNDLDPENIRVSAQDATETVKRLLRVYPQAELGEPALLVYQYHPAGNRPPKSSADPSNARRRFLAEVENSISDRGDAADIPREGRYYLAWDIVVTTHQPSHSWRILVDAMTGRPVNVVDLMQYASGTSQVFDPNPTVTTGDLTLSSASPIAVVDSQRIAVAIDHLDPPVDGKLHLDGGHVKIEEIEDPVFPEPVSSTGDFSFSYGDRNFLAAMVYFHIDRFQQYVQTDLGMANVASISIPVDPQGVDGADNSRYDPIRMNLAFGEGGVPDASDAHVILHEYGHAIQDNPLLRVPPFNLPRSTTTQVGFPRALAISSRPPTTMTSTSTPERHGER